jgi:hypothetical protein
MSSLSRCSACGIEPILTEVFSRLFVAFWVGHLLSLLYLTIFFLSTLSGSLSFGVFLFYESSILRLEQVSLS